jgi:hypothetical protein
MYHVMEYDVIEQYLSVHLDSIGLVGFFMPIIVSTQLW